MIYRFTQALVCKIHKDPAATSGKRKLFSATKMTQTNPRKDTTGSTALLRRRERIDTRVDQSWWHPSYKRYQQLLHFTIHSQPTPKQYPLQNKRTG